MKATEIEQTKTKEEIVEILNTNKIDYNMTKCNDSEKICISLGDESNCCCNSVIAVQTSNKDIVCRVYLSEILYIAIENRKSVLYMTDRKIETNYHIDYWKDILNQKCFAQPHYSYIVNLNYVDEVTKDFVTLRYGDNKYKVYSSLRRIGAFKKTFFNYKR